MLQTIPSFYSKISEKRLFISAITYEKYSVCTDYCIAHHDVKTCFLPTCKPHIILLRNVEELLKKLDTFSSPINTRTVCIHYSSFDSVKKLLQRVDKCSKTCNEQLTLITETREWTECRALKKKRLSRKNFKKHLFSSFRKTKTTQTSGSVFAGRIEKVKKTKFELELKKIVDCFVDGHGNYDSNLVSLRIKSL